MNTFNKIAVGIAVSAIAGVAYAQMSHDGSKMMDTEAMQEMMKDMMPAQGDAESTKAFKQADITMMHDMAVPYTGNADVDFRAKMIPHHQGAIAMAKAALQHGTDAETKKLAEQIIAAQEKEIAEMEAWLAANKK